jgi:hypothetical protein
MSTLNDTSTLYFYGWTIKELEEILCPPLDPNLIFNLNKGEGNLVRKNILPPKTYYIQVPYILFKQILTILLLENIACVDVTSDDYDRAYKATKSDDNGHRPHLMMQSPKTLRIA